MTDTSTSLGALRLIDAEARLGDFHLQPTSLTVHAGELLCILGPSGAGKSTILGLIGGWVPMAGGEVLVGERIISHEAIDRRPVRVCFQKGGYLFPHLSVAENVAFSLRMKRQSKKVREKRVVDILAEVGLGGYEARQVESLSGGEAQRVAIARAMADPQPVLLLDEVEAGLDRELRATIREVIEALVREYGVRALYVSHNAPEALALASRIGGKVAVMEPGKVVQVGAPRELYHHPETTEVATLTGAVNQLTADQCGAILGLSDPSGRARYGLVRPEQLKVRMSGHGSDRLGTVRTVEFHGAAIHIVVSFGPVTLTALLTDGIQVRKGDDVSLEVSGEVVWVSE